MSLYERSFSTLNYYLQTLKAEAGMPRLALNDDGCCYFSIGDSPLISIYLMPNGENVRISSFVFDEERHLSQDQLLKLLNWNFNCTFLHNSVIGYCDITKRLTLKLEFHIDRVNEVNLYNLCQNFGADLIKLRQNVNELSHGNQQRPTLANIPTTNLQKPAPSQHNPQATISKPTQNLTTLPHFWLQI